MQMESQKENIQVNVKLSLLQVNLMRLNFYVEIKGKNFI